MAVIKGLSCVVLLTCMVIAGAPISEAAVTSCTQVATSIAPCIKYLTAGGALPPACCSGIRGLNAAASTTSDRRATCRCLKGIASGIPGLNYGRAAALPGSCGVNLPYKFSQSLDCNRVP